MNFTKSCLYITLLIFVTNFISTNPINQNLVADLVLDNQNLQNQNANQLERKELVKIFATGFIYGLTMPFIQYLERSSNGPMSLLQFIPVIGMYFRLAPLIMPIFL